MRVATYNVNKDTSISGRHGRSRRKYEPEMDESALPPELPDPYATPKMEFVTTI